MARQSSKFKPRRSSKAGLPPGSLVYTGEQKMEQASVSVFSYSETKCKERAKATFEDLKKYRDDVPTKEWINVNGIHDIVLIEKIGNLYQLHNLLLEDVLSPHQRPKVDEYDNCIYVVARMVFWDDKQNGLHSEQISLILLADSLISFQEIEGDVFNPIRERLRMGKGRVRKAESDYLLYTLLDNIVDNYFVVLEKIGDQLETLEMELFNSPKEDTIKTIHGLKREMIFLKKSVWPLRDVINTLQRNENSLMQKTTLVYLKDLYDHIVQVNENIDIYRDMLTGMQDMYLSSISNRMTMVMKVLTMIATIFIPLTFIVGVYGMNFKFMPELDSKYGYPLVWVIMILISLGMLYYFRKKKWL